MKVLVTGGAGFIGCHLVDRLKKLGHEVVIYDKMEHGIHSPISYLYGPDWREQGFYFADILDRQTLKRAMVGVDTVFHLAAMLGIENVEAHPVETVSVEVEGTKAVLDAARAEGKPRVFVWSTSEVYGQCDSGLTEDDVTPVGVAGEARWSYQASKVAADHLTIGYAKEYGLPTTVIRPFNVFGPCQVRHGAICKFINRALRNWDLQIYGDGLQTRSWMHVENLIDAIMLLCDSPPAVSAGQIFNIGDPSAPMHMLTVAMKIIARTKSNSKITHLPKRPVDVDYRVPNATKMMELGWKPRINFIESLEETIEWYRNFLNDDYLVW